MVDQQRVLIGGDQRTISGCRGIKGVYKGGEMGVILGPFWSNQLSCTRARAYNDCAQDAVLLKTASKHVQEEVYMDPKMDPFWGPSEWSYRHTIQATWAYPYVQYTCKYVLL